MTQNITSKEECEAFLAECKSAVGILFFWAPWSEPCKQLQEVMTELSNETSQTHVRLAQIEAEVVPEVSLQYEIIAVPTIVFVRDGEVFDRIDGAYAADLTKKVRQFNTGFVPVIPKMAASNGEAPIDPKQGLKDRLEKLIKSATCLLFMKGSPDKPKCGFSKQIIELLLANNVQFKSFDILEDEQVRQGLKEFSNWPTYPQLYINGELIGGLDIVREMAENGELQAQLPNTLSLSERLKQLIHKSDIMVFMKGNPKEPRCKFSRSLMEIFSEIKVNFDSFDILQDEEMRQGLKEYSNWPTYPQIYVKGEFVGGLDIIKELKESGELEQTLQVQ